MEARVCQLHDRRYVTSVGDSFDQDPVKDIVMKLHILGQIIAPIINYSHALNFLLCLCAMCNDTMHCTFDIHNLSSVGQHSRVQNLLTVYMPAFVLLPALLCLPTLSILLVSCFLGTPGAAPYGGCSLHFNQVEANMKLRSVLFCI